MKNLFKKQQEVNARKALAIFKQDFESALKNTLTIDVLWTIFKQCPVLTISQRVELAVMGEKLLGNRRGSRSDIKIQRCYCDENAYQLRFDQTEVGMRLLHHDRNCLYRGKTRQIIAQLFDFSSGSTYLLAKAVVQSGQLDLIKAMDNKKISIYQASLKLPRKKSVKTLLSNYGSILLAIYALANKVDYGSKLFLKESLFILDFIIEYCSIAANSCLSVPLTAKPP